MAEELVLGPQYAAGLFEGEGCAFIHKRTDGRLGSGLSLSMTDLEPIEAFRSVVQVGTIHGPRHHKTQPNNKPFWEWRVTSIKEVHHVARMLWPYLSPRRQGKLEEAISVYRGDHHRTKPLVVG